MGDLRLSREEVCRSNTMVCLEGLRSWCSELFLCTCHEHLMLSLETHQSQLPTLAWGRSCAVSEHCYRITSLLEICRLKSQWIDLKVSAVWPQHPRVQKRSHVTEYRTGFVLGTTGKAAVWLPSLANAKIHSLAETLTLPTVSSSASASWPLQGLYLPFLCKSAWFRSSFNKRHVLQFWGRIWLERHWDLWAQWQYALAKEPEKSFKKEDYAIHHLEGLRETQLETTDTAKQ